MRIPLRYPLLTRVLAAEWSDYVKGEWWISPDGHAEFADSNIGDMGHEGIAERNILGDYADELWEALEAYNAAHPDEAVKLVDREHDEGDAIHQQYHDGGIPPEVGEQVLGKERWDLFRSDVRTYYMKFDDMVLAINLTFAVWKLSDQHIKVIQTLIAEEAQDEVEDAESEMSIEELSTQRYVTMPVQYFMSLDRAKQFWEYEQHVAGSVDSSRYPALAVVLKNLSVVDYPA